MFDLKVIAIRDILNIIKVDYAKGPFPKSLDIIGEKLNRTTEVLVNDVPTTEIIILSPNRIIVQIPVAQARSQINRVVVLATTPTPGERSLLNFEIGRSFQRLQGIERLVQLFTKLVIQTPGSDRFRPDLGGGLRALTGTNVDKGAGKALQASVVSCINRTRDQIIQLQNRNARIPADERLRSALTQSAGFNPTTTTMAVRVGIQAVSGQQAIANLSF